MEVLPKQLSFFPNVMVLSDVSGEHFSTFMIVLPAVWKIFNDCSFPLLSFKTFLWLKSYVYYVFFFTCTDDFSLFFFMAIC